MRAGRGVIASVVMLASTAVSLSSCSISTIGRMRDHHASATVGPKRAMLFTRYELTFDDNNSAVVKDNDDGDAARRDDDIHVRFTSPSGKVIRVGAFRSHGQLKVRFTPRELGLHRWSVGSSSSSSSSGKRPLADRRGELEVTSSERRGFVQVDPKYPHRLVSEPARSREAWAAPNEARDGPVLETTFMLGANLPRVAALPPPALRASLERLTANGITTVRVILPTPTRPEVAGLDEQTADAFDALFSLVEEMNIDVVLVAFASTSSRTTRTSTRPSTRMNMSQDARLLRTIADRWASSPRLLAIDLVDAPERHGRIAAHNWIRRAQTLSQTWRTFDPYDHLVTSGRIAMSHDLDGTERVWYASTSSDVALWHLEDRAPSGSAHSLSEEATLRTKAAWVFDKPLCAASSFSSPPMFTTSSASTTAAEERPSSSSSSSSSYEPGTGSGADDAAHVVAWAHLLSGAGVFVKDDRTNLAPLATFLRSLDSQRAYSPHEDVSIFSAPRRASSANESGEPHDADDDDDADDDVADQNERGKSRTKARVLSLASDDLTDRALWVLAPSRGYGEVVSGVTLTIPTPRESRWRVTWFDDETGQRLSGARQPVVANNNDVLILAAPPFIRHIAARVTHE